MEIHRACIKNLVQAALKKIKEIAIRKELNTSEWDIGGQREVVTIDTLDLAE